MTSQDSPTAVPSQTQDDRGATPSDLEALRGQVTELRHHLQRAEADANRIRSVILLFGCWTSALLVVLGLITPYITVTTENSYGQTRSHTYPLVAVFAHITDGPADSAAIAFGIGFGGLVVVALLALFVLRSIAGRHASRAMQGYARVLSILLSIGCAVALALAVGNPGTSHDGPVFLTVGTVVLMILTSSSVIRDWWAFDLRPRR